MPKAYWIVRVDVTDAEAYAAYATANAKAYAKYGARFLVRGGPVTVIEGTGRQRNAVIEFADRATALACYESPEYQAAKRLRAGAGEPDIVIVEAYEGPQPAVAVA